MIPQLPWQRVHVDHAHFGGHLLLVAVDAYSKWLEVHIVSSTSAQQTIDKLIYIYACHGFPATLISDNWLSIFNLQSSNSLLWQMVLCIAEFPLPSLF